MKLYQLLEGVPFQSSLANIEITEVCGDSRQVEPGAVFVCRKGLKFDGHDHAAQALLDGAVAIVVERDLGLPNQVLVDDTHYAYSVLSGNFFGNPARKLKMVGVTGTNGKTTTTYLMKHILEAAGKQVGLIGTIQTEIRDMTLPAKHTTPDPLQLHTMLSRMVQAGCEYVVMEVSSHALDQQRVAGCRFAGAVFTNLTQDHLDYHHDMEGYYQAKKKLFAMADFAVINGDDPYGRRLLEEGGCPMVSYSLSDPEADYYATGVQSFADGSAFTLATGGEEIRVRIGMPGSFSVQNALGAAICCLGLGTRLDTVLSALRTCPGVPGRFEVIPTDTPFTVIRDYAHTADGIEKILTAVNTFKPARVITLFGCAGSRDRTKRHLMGRAAGSLSDFCILTSDNPREEDPLQIIGDCLPGLQATETPYIVIPDRYEAIKWGLENAEPQDILLLLGKGHEDYQVLSFGTIYFDEKVIVQQLLAGEPRTWVRPENFKR